MTPRIRAHRPDDDRPDDAPPAPLHLDPTAAFLLLMTKAGRTPVVRQIARQGLRRRGVPARLIDDITGVQS